MDFTQPQRVFLTQRVLRTVAGKWTFVTVSGRVEWDHLIAKMFKGTGAVSEAVGDQWRGRRHAFNERVLLEDVPREEEV